MRVAEDILPAGTREHIAELCREFGVEGLGVFGSVALGEDEPGRSDVDVLVKFRDDAPARQRFVQFLALRDALEVAFGRTVDLVQATEFQNPIFAENLVRSLVPLYGERIQVQAIRYPAADHGVNMEPKARKCLIDILQAAEAILQYTSDLSEEDYGKTPIVRDATERRIEIIGEAIGKLRKLDPEMAARIPDAGKIVSMRNILVHQYDRIDNESVWRAVRDHVPALIELAQSLLAEADD